MNGQLIDKLSRGIPVRVSHPIGSQYFKPWKPIDQPGLQSSSDDNLHNLGTPPKMGPLVQGERPDANASNGSASADAFVSPPIPEEEEEEEGEEGPIPRPGSQAPPPHGSLKQQTRPTARGSPQTDSSAEAKKLAARGSPPAKTPARKFSKATPMTPSTTDESTASNSQAGVRELMQMVEDIKVDFPPKPTDRRTKSRTPMRIVSGSGSHRDGEDVMGPTTTGQSPSHTPSYQLDKTGASPADSSNKPEKSPPKAPPQQQDVEGQAVSCSPVDKSGPRDDGKEMNYETVIRRPEKAKYVPLPAEWTGPSPPPSTHEHATAVVSSVQLQQAGARDHEAHPPTNPKPDAGKTQEGSSCPATESVQARSGEATRQYLDTKQYASASESAPAPASTYGQGVATPSQKPSGQEALSSSSPLTKGTQRMGHGSYNYYKRGDRPSNNNTAVPSSAASTTTTPRGGPPLPVPPPYPTHAHSANSFRPPMIPVSIPLPAFPLRKPYYNRPQLSGSGQKWYRRQLTNYYYHHSDNFGNGIPAPAAGAGASSMNPPPPPPPPSTGAFALQESLIDAQRRTLEAEGRLHRVLCKYCGRGPWNQCRCQHQYQQGQYQQGQYQQSQYQQGQDPGTGSHGVDGSGGVEMNGNRLRVPAHGWWLPSESAPLPIPAASYHNDSKSEAAKKGGDTGEGRFGDIHGDGDQDRDGNGPQYGPAPSTTRGHEYGLPNPLPPFLHTTDINRRIRFSEVFGVDDDEPARLESGSELSHEPFPAYHDPLAQGASSATTTVETGKKKTGKKAETQHNSTKEQTTTTTAAVTKHTPTPSEASTIILPHAIAGSATANTSPAKKEGSIVSSDHHARGVISNQLSAACSNSGTLRRLPSPKPHDNAEKKNENHGVYTIPGTQPQTHKGRTKKDNSDTGADLANDKPKTDIRKNNKNENQGSGKKDDANDKYPPGGSHGSIASQKKDSARSHLAPPSGLTSTTSTCTFTFTAYVAGRGEGMPLAEKNEPTTQSPFSPGKSFCPKTSATSTSQLSGAMSSARQNIEGQGYGQRRGQQQQLDAAASDRSASSPLSPTKKLPQLKAPASPNATDTTAPVSGKDKRKGRQLGAGPPLLPPPSTSESSPLTTTVAGLSVDRKTTTGPVKESSTTAILLPKTDRPSSGLSPAKSSATITTSNVHAYGYATGRPRSQQSRSKLSQSKLSQAFSQQQQQQPARPRGQPQLIPQPMIKTTTMEAAQGPPPQFDSAEDWPELPSTGTRSRATAGTDTIKSIATASTSKSKGQTKEKEDEDKDEDKIDKDEDKEEGHGQDHKQEEEQKAAAMERQAQEDPEVATAGVSIRNETMAWVARRTWSWISSLNIPENYSYEVHNNNDGDDQQKKEHWSNEWPGENGGGDGERRGG